MGNIILLDELEKYDTWGTPSTFIKPGTYQLLLQGIYPFELPKTPNDEKEIFFYNKKTEDQYWQRPGAPANWKELSSAKQEKWIEEETIRCFDTGAYVFIKGQPVWLPPAFWFTLNWWYTKDGYMNLRMCQLLEEYFECFCEQDRWCIGTFRFKKRRDGLTTRRMARKIWKAIQTKEGWFGMQSKTGNDAKKVCWSIMMRGFKKLPTFFLPELGGTTDPKTVLEFKKPSERISKKNKGILFDNDDIFRQLQDDDDLNTTIDWRDTTSDAYDGQQVVELTLDEFGKWKKASALDCLYTCKRSCQLDGVKVGMIHAITSPPETDGPPLEDCLAAWDESDYTKIKNDETFKIYRWLTSGLDSYAGAIDKYGFCDRDKANSEIDKERNSAPARKKKAVIRQTVKYIDEIFDAIENNVFTTAPEMKAREKFLKSIHFKTGTSEPKYIFGNFDWLDGIEFDQVTFKPSANQEDFSFAGRWAVSKMPTEGGQGNTWLEKFRNNVLLKSPPLESEYVLGVDPYDFRRVADGGRASNGAGSMGKCFDFYGMGDANEIAAVYDFRPPDPNIFYADQLKAAIFYGAYINAESRNMKFHDYCEDYGYFDYLLPKDVTNSKKKDIKGSPTTNPMIQEMCTLIDSFAASFLDAVWLEMMIEDWTRFNPADTKKSNLTMACGHMFLGFAKRRRLFKKKTKITPEEKYDLFESISDCFM